MAEKSECISCHGKRTVLCPCCSGKGWIVVSPYPPRLGKAHTCIDCTGLGEIPCPQCRPRKILVPTGTLKIAPNHFP